MLVSLKLDATVDAQVEVEGTYHSNSGRHKPYKATNEEACNGVRD